MRTSETIDALAAALAKAQSEMTNAAFNRTNPHFRSKYADLASIRDAVTPSLTKNGIAVVQLTEPSEGFLLVITRLIHSSGQWIESQYPIINDVNKPQAMGSALTYAKRYSLSAICNIASEEDDDGNAAQEQGAKPAEVRSIAGTEGARKSAARAPYDALVKELRLATTVSGLKEWLKENRARVDALPADWLALFDEDYMSHRDSLEAKAA